MRKILSIIAVLVTVFLWGNFAFAGSQQTSGVTAQVIIDDVRNGYLNESSTSGTTLFWDDTKDLLTYINYGLIDIANQSFALQTTENITLSSGDSVYAISTSYFDIETIINNDASGVTNASLRRGNLQSVGHSLADANTTKRPAYWVDWGGSVLIYPEPESRSSGYNLTVYLYERPSGVTIQQAIPTPAIYDFALVYFVVKEAWKKKKRFDLSNIYEVLYKNEMDRLRSFFNKRPKESERIVK